MGYSRFWLKAADEESKSIPHEFPRSHWLKATGQCVLERYLSATMPASCHQIFISMYLKAFIQNFGQIGTVVSEKTSLNFCMYTTFGQGQEMTMTFNTHISSYI